MGFVLGGMTAPESFAALASFAQEWFNGQHFSGSKLAYA